MGDNCMILTEKLPFSMPLGIPILVMDSTPNLAPPLITLGNASECEVDFTMMLLAMTLPDSQNGKKWDTFANIKHPLSTMIRTINAFHVNTIPVFFHGTSYEDAIPQPARLDLES